MPARGIVSVGHSSQTTPQRPLPTTATRPTATPSYGAEAEAESGAYEDYYEEDEEDGLEEAIAALEEGEGGYEDESEGDEFETMGDAWPCAVPNRLADPFTPEDGSAPVTTSPDDPRLSNLGLPLALPYEVETLAEMDDRLELICQRLVECVKAREYGMGFRMWDSALTIWMSMGYAMKRDIKIKLIFLYYELLFVPNLSGTFVDNCGNQLIPLLSDRSLSIWDFRMPWRPLYDALYNELFPHPNKLARHSFNLAPTLLNVAESAQRFFHPADMDEMLEVILPQFEPSMDSILATQTFLVHFLPISHPQRWMPLSVFSSTPSLQAEADSTVFRLWSGFNSGLWDDQASDLMGQLSISHTDPGKSDPSLLDRIPRGTFNTPEEEARNPGPKKAERQHQVRQLTVKRDVIEDDDGLTYWTDPEKISAEPRVEDPNWQGIRKDIGIFTEQEFEFLMTKCLRSLNVPVGGSIASHNAMSITAADARTSKKVLDAKKPIDRVQSLAETIIYSVAEDADATKSGSATATPGAATPVNPALARVQNGSSMKRSGSQDSLAAAGRQGDTDRKYMAGSKALDHLSRLLTSCETFFHPSNSGNWSAFLTVFLAHLAHNFVERWKAEEEPTCRTPEAWRLTPTIKREFVLCMRPLALTAMFNKDMDSVASAVSTLKRLSILEPDLIMPALMERIVPSLQGLEETNRTPAVTYALAALAQPLSARQLWRMGGMYVADSFALLLPGIDLNDPAKTGLSCMAISNMVDFIRIGDISDTEEIADATPGSRALRKAPRPPLQDDPNDPSQQELEDLSPEEVNSRVRFATSAFRDWVPEFLGRVLLLFSNLPEEGGKTGKAGGKTEQLTLMSVLHTCGGVFAALDDKLFEAVLEQVAEYATTTTRSNGVDAVGELIRNLAATRAPQVWARLFPTCRARIIAELKAGASSTRTQTTSIPRASDAGLHWWQSILYGMLIPGRIDLSDPKWRTDYLDLMKTMIDSTHSERGWHWTGKLVEKSISCLTSIYFAEMSMLESERDSDDVKNNHTLWWGKLYRASEIQPSWRVPSESQISMSLDMLTLAEESATKLGDLIDNRKVGDNVWSNEFCRAASVLDKTLRGSYNLIAEINELKEGGEAAESYLPAEILRLLPPYKSGIILSDPSDPRYQRVSSFRQRVGEILNRAASAMRDAGESDNSVESVKILVSTIGTYLTAYGIRSKQFSNAQTAYTGMQATKRMYETQRKQHRHIFMAAASVHSQNRLTTLAYYRVRSALDDKLIRNMLDFCLSPFVRVRRSAQGTLETIAKIYRGTWVLCFPLLFDALQPGTDPDRMKGALYVLRYNYVGISRIGRDWRHLVQLVECLLSAHHENKASVQALVTKATDELIASIKEPSSLMVEVDTEKLDAAADALGAIIRRKVDLGVVGQLRQSHKDLIALQDKGYDTFIDKVLAISKNPNLNWRYVWSASRFLYTMTRRDKPTDVRLAKFFAENVQNPHPRIRDFGTIGLTRMLFHIALRSLCGGDERRLVLQEPIDPFSRDIELTDTSPAFTAQYLAAFRQPVPGKQEEAVLQDRLDSGWLVWGKTMEVSRLSGWEEQAWTVDPDCMPAVEMLRELMGQEGWWQKLADQWAQEDTRNYPSATHIDFVLAIAQIYGLPILDAIKPIVDAYMAEMDSTKIYDRHKMRAIFEFVSGLLRGTEEWPGKDRAVLWEWFTPKLPDLFGNIRHDTTKCWDISIEYVLNERDPRRYQPLVDFCINTALAADFQSGSAFDLARRVQLVRSVLRCQRWRFNAWTDDFVDFYFRSVTCPYAEVRNLIASVLNGMDQIKFHPSFSSATALNKAILDDPTNQDDLMQIRSGYFAPQLKGIMEQLPKWKEERPHGPKAVQSEHDNAAMTTLAWLTVELSDVHAAAAFPYIIPILPEIFELRELNDNPDLQRLAGRMLALITAITPALPLIEPVMDALISILENSSSWKMKMHSMPVLSLVYFRNLSLLSETCKAKCLDVVAASLRDANQEVREMASSTLSGFLRCSQRSMVVVLKDRFAREIRSTTLTKRRGQPGQIDPEYQEQLVRLHGAILGATAIVEAFPYTVPKFMPKLLADVLAPRVSDPAPISTTIRTCVASFKRTHEKYQDKFSEDELSAMNYAQAGNSYYA